MGEDPMELTRKEAFELLDALWAAHETLVGTGHLAGAADVLRHIDRLERRLFG